MVREGEGEEEEEEEEENLAMCNTIDIWIIMQEMGGCVCVNVD